MSWKQYIFTEDAEAANKSEPKKEVPKDSGKSFTSKFPSSETTTKTMPNSTPSVETPVVTSASDPACAPHMSKILDMYENGFKGLNQDGYDFFEFYQAIIAAGVSNAAAYKMALTMASTMDSSVSKESLLSQSQFYINEINKVYNDYVSNGNSKRNEIIQQKANEEASLSNELKEIDSEIARLTALKVTKQNSLTAIDGSYQPTLVDIDCKLMANDEAKNKIINSIESVVNGIKSNV